MGWIFRDPEPMSDYEAHQAMQASDRAADRRRADRQQGRERAAVKSAFFIYRTVEAAIPTGDDVDRATSWSWSLFKTAAAKAVDAPDDMRRAVDEVATSPWSIWKR